MRDSVVRHFAAALCCLISGITISLVPSLHAVADEIDQGNYTTKNTSSNYNPGSRNVTVTANGSKPGSKGVAGAVSHAGQVFQCGAWRPATATPLTDCNDQLPGPSVAQIATQAAASVTLPLNGPQFGPSPSQNKWDMVPVGYPVWLWTSSDQGTISTTVEADGLTVSITATRQSVNFAMGDGHSVSCKSFTARPTHLADPMQKSPTCGYVYQTTGNFTITATTSWLVAWSASGESGSFTVADTASSPAPLPIGELTSVIIGHP